MTATTPFKSKTSRVRLSPEEKFIDIIYIIFLLEYG